MSVPPIDVKTCVCAYEPMCASVQHAEQQRIRPNATADIGAFILLLSYIYQLLRAFISKYKMLIQAVYAEELFIGHFDQENTAFFSCLIALYLACRSVLEIYVLICLRILVVIYFWK